jgi:arylsulfatase A
MIPISVSCLIMLLLSLHPLKGIEEEPAEDQKPNIVFILADDLGYGDLSCYNTESKINTSHIDRLATQGICFMDAHSPSSVCTPTRYGFLTGRYAWRGTLKQGVIEGDHTPLLEEGRETVASLLQKKGYRTAVFGKWHLGLTFRDSLGKPAHFDDNGVQFDIDFTRGILDGPIQHGFDEALVSPGCPSDDVFNFWIHNDRIPANLEKRGSAIYQEGWAHENVDTMLTYRTMSFIENHVASRPDEPFFVYLPLSIPHIPWEPPEFVRGKTDAGSRGDQVFLADWCVSQIDSLLEDLNLKENTLLIFTSDNGPREGVNGHDASGLFRGQKGEIWEGGHRIPLIVRWPEKIQAGSRCGHIVCLTDFYATFADLLGKELSVFEAEDSFSLLPYLLGENPDESIRQDIIHHSGAGLFSLRKGNWKLIVGSEGGGYHEGGPVAGSPGQLYDLASDPYETSNLWSQKQELVTELDSLLNLYITQGFTRQQ